MKKFALIAVALCVAFMMAAPAGALEITTDGYFRTQYVGSWNVKMADKSFNNAANSYGLMRLRVNNVIKVNDNLSIRTRFRALNNTFGDYQEAGTASNFDWERAWMVARMNFGIVEIGRMQGGTWGTAFGDAEVEADRVKLTVPVGPVTLLAIYQKSAELDQGFETADTDADTFYLAGVWKHETMSAGLLGAYTSGKTASDTAPGTAATPASRYYSGKYALLPYFTGKFGPFGLVAEGIFNFGKAVEWVENIPGLQDRDATGYSWNLEGTFDFGMGSAQLGYAFASGQEKPKFAGDQVDNTAGTIGADWCKLLIMTGDTVPATDGGALGGYGSWGNGGNQDGIGLIYAGADFKPMENLSLGFVWGWGKADETDPGQDSDIGWEIDVNATYTIFDNLTNFLSVGYLSGGDYFQGSKWDANYWARKQNFDSDVWAVLNELKLSF
jgi:hypothetical protein